MSHEAERLYRANQEREAALRSLLKSASASSETAEIASLRLKIRDGYEKLLSLDPAFAAAHEVEPQVRARSRRACALAR